MLYFPTSMASPVARTLTCPTHGVSGPAFVCRHLLDVSGAPCGFFEPDTLEDPGEPQAWCQACDQVLKQEGEWNDTSEEFAGVSLVCAGCFEKMRTHHGVSRH